MKKSLFLIFLGVLLFSCRTEEICWHFAAQVDSEQSESVYKNSKIYRINEQNGTIIDTVDVDGNIVRDGEIIGKLEITSKKIIESFMVDGETVSIWQFDRKTGNELSSIQYSDGKIESITEYDKNTGFRVRLTVYNDEKILFTREYDRDTGKELETR